MSYTLGVSSSSVMQGHFNSPTSKSYPEVSKEGLPQESKDVLVDRLNDLVLRISKVGVLRGKAISTIHAQVDKIDILVNRVEAIERPNLPSREVLRNGTPPTDFGEPSTPTQNLPMSLPIYSHASNCSSTPGAVDKSPKSAAEVAKAAADLASRLSTIVAEFQLRNKESNRIHDWLVAKNKRATQRTLMLEHRITELEEDFQSNQSELTFLRIQLQSIQAQCAGCIHRHEDPELEESIMNWKIDWEDINRQATARRKNIQISLTNQTSDSSTVVDSS